MNCKENTKPQLSIHQKVELFFIVLSGFVINFVLFGFIASLSVYFVKYKRAFPKHYDMVLLTIFLHTGVFSTVGILAGMFLHRFGVRATAVWGSIFLSIGIGSSCFAPNIIFLMCFFGILSGIGSSLLYCSMNVGVAAHLEKSGRHLMPLVDMGGSAGGVVCPPLVSFLIDIYGWRTSLLLFSAITLNSLPCGLIYSIKNRNEFHRGKTSTGKLKVEKDKNSKVRQDSYGETDIDKSHCTDADDTDNLAINERSLHQHLTTSSVLDDGSSLKGQLSESNEQVENIENTTVGEMSQKHSFLSIFSNKQFLIYLLTMTVVVSSELTLSAMTSDFFVSKGTTRSVAAQIYGIGFSGEIIAHISSTWLLYKYKTQSLLIFSISAILSGVFVMIYPSIPMMSSLSSAGGAIFLAVCEMTAHGHYQAVCIIIILEFFDAKRYPLAIGLTMTVSGIFIPIFGYIIGLITRYNNNDYSIAFYILATMTIVFTLPTFILFRVKQRKDTRNKLRKNRK